ncbi:MAG: MurR/RpiR family transcriptional regulator [Pseudarthrobacter sp.]|nr:MurR/RpiR family transcriptional regulator [Pseudarthrobacter sp.]
MTSPDTAERWGASRLIAHVRSTAASMTPSERRVVSVFLQNTGDVVGWSVLQVGAAAGTSTATVVRTCQRLGFTGYQQFRTELARVAGEPNVDAESDGLLGQVFAAARQEIDATMALLDRDAFRRATESVAAARKILLLGTGGSSIPAQDAALRFTMSGRTAMAPPDVLAQVFSARLLAPEDVCIAVSFSGANDHTLRAVEAARDARAKVIAVTSAALSPLSRLADITLVTGTSSVRTEVLASRITHGLVLNALNLSVQQLSGEASFGPSGDLAQLLNNVLRGTAEE